MEPTVFGKVSSESLHSMSTSGNWTHVHAPQKASALIFRPPRCLSPRWFTLSGIFGENPATAISLDTTSIRLLRL